MAPLFLFQRKCTFILLFSFLYQTSIPHLPHQCVRLVDVPVRNKRAINQSALQRRHLRCKGVSRVGVGMQVGRCKPRREEVLCVLSRYDHVQRVAIVGTMVVMVACACAHATAGIRLVVNSVFHGEH